MRRSDCHVCFRVSAREDWVACELYINDSKVLFSELYQQKDLIEKDLGMEKQLDWQELPERKASRIRASFSFDFDDDKTWEGAFPWLADTCIRFRKTFSKNWVVPIELTSIHS